MLKLIDITNQNINLSHMNKNKLLSSLEFNNFLMQKGTKVLCFGLYNDSQLIDYIHVVVYPVKKIFKIGVIHYMTTNFIQSLNIIHKQLKQLLKKYKIIHLYMTTEEYAATYDIESETTIINPPFEIIDKILQQHNFIKTNPKHGAVKDILWQYKKDLTNFKTEEDLLASYSSTRRKEIARAKKLGCNIVELNYNQLHRFISLYNETAKKHHTVQYDIDYIQNLYHAFNPTNKITVAVCEMDIQTCLNYLNDLKTKLAKEGTFQNKLDKIQAQTNKLSNMLKKQKTIDLSSGVCFQEKDEYIIFISGNSEEFSDYYGCSFLQHSMIKKALDLNLPYFNFYGTPGTYGDYTNQGYGVYEFKKAFRGFPIQYPHYSYALNKFLSKIFKL